MISRALSTRLVSSRMALSTPATAPRGATSCRPLLISASWRLRSCVSGATLVWATRSTVERVFSTRFASSRMALSSEATAPRGARSPSERLRPDNSPRKPATSFSALAGGATASASTRVERSRSAFSTAGETSRAPFIVENSARMSSMREDKASMPLCSRSMRRSSCGAALIWTMRSSFLARASKRSSNTWDGGGALGGNGGARSVGTARAFGRARVADAAAPCAARRRARAGAPKSRLWPAACRAAGRA